MRHPFFRYCSFIMAALSATGFMLANVWADGDEPMLTITGELTYLQRIALPGDAVAFVELRPLSAPVEAPPTALTRIEMEGRQVPVAFTLELPRAHLEEGDYVLSGGILIAGELRWGIATVDVDVSKPLFDAGTLLMSPKAQEKAVGEKAMEEHSPSRPVTLVGEWRIAKIGGNALGEEAMITFSADGEFSGRLCNSYRGSYQVDGSDISFGQAAATLMACPQPLASQERALFAAFEATASYRIELDGTLVLLDGEGKPRLSARQQ